MLLLLLFFSCGLLCFSERLLNQVSYLHSVHRNVFRNVKAKYVYSQAGVREGWKVGINRHNKFLKSVTLTQGKTKINRKQFARTTATT